MDTQGIIEKLVNSNLQAEDLFLVEVSVSGAQNSMKVAIEIDGDDGINIDQCAELSRKVGAEIEEMELFDCPYRLEVSSPGIDKPLRMKRQYAKNAGREVKVVLNDGTEVSGLLESVLEEEIKVKPLKKNLKKGQPKKYEEERSIPFELINKTNIIISFK